MTSITSINAYKLYIKYKNDDPKKSNFYIRNVYGDRKNIIRQLRISRLDEIVYHDFHIRFNGRIQMEGESIKYV